MLLALRKTIMRTGSKLHSLNDLHDKYKKHFLILYINTKFNYIKLTPYKVITTITK